MVNASSLGGFLHTPVVDTGATKDNFMPGHCKVIVRLGSMVVSIRSLLAVAWPARNPECSGEKGQ